MSVTTLSPCAVAACTPCRRHTRTVHQPKAAQNVPGSPAVVAGFCLPGQNSSFPVCLGSQQRVTHRNTLKLRCFCVSSKDTGRQLTRQTVKQAIQTSIRDEKPYLLKLLLASIVGAATVKFGSLAIDTPFNPSLLTAVGIITLPCILFSLILWKLPE